MESFPIIDPHSILSYLFDEVGIQLDHQDIARFWQHSRAMGEPWALASPATEAHVPLGLHGDGARLWTIYQVEKMVAIHINIIHFRPTSVRHSRFLVFTCPREKLIKNRSLNVAFRRLTWSLNSASEGIHPRTGPAGGPLFGRAAKLAGTPLCKTGLQFCMCELRGDWEWFRDIFRFTASWQSREVCYRCPAVAKLLPGDDDDGHIYYNNSESSTWLRYEFSLQQFVARRLKETNLCC